MKRSPIGLLACAWIICVLSAFQATRAEHGQPATPTVDYQRDVHPILAAKCLTCHSQEKR
jgi:hypothetical protein